MEFVLLPIPYEYFKIILELWKSHQNGTESSFNIFHLVSLTLTSCITVIDRSKHGYDTINEPRLYSGFTDFSINNPFLFWDPVQNPHSVQLSGLLTALQSGTFLSSPFS